MVQAASWRAATAILGLGALLALSGCTTIKAWQKGGTPADMKAETTQEEPARRHAPIDPDRCVVIDTDVSLDGIRGIAALTGNARIAAIITTAGVSSAERGASAVAHLLAPGLEQPPILVGLTSPDPINPPWLAGARSTAERLNYFLAAAVPKGPPTTYLPQMLQRLVRDCRKIDVLMMGPWTSFASYAPVLGARITRVIAEGPAPSEWPQGQPVFNCAYDRAACRTALDEDLTGGKITWVDVPSRPEFQPSPDMFDRLVKTGRPATLAVIMSINPAGLADAYLWDDAVALYWYKPELFTSQGQHMVPNVDATAFKRAWWEAVNEGTALPYN